MYFKPLPPLKRIEEGGEDRLSEPPPERALETLQTEKLMPQNR